MLNGTLTVIAKVHSEAVEPLAERLRALDLRMQSAEPHPFDKLENIHFAHWSILGRPAPGTVSPAPSSDCYLLFGADMSLWGDPPRKLHLQACIEQLVDRLASPRNAPCARLFDELFSLCVGYPPDGLIDPEAVKEYLLRNAVNYTARHVDFAYRVATVPDIRDIMRLRGEVERFLDAPSLRPSLEPLRPTQVHEALRYHFDKRLSGNLSEPHWERRLASAQFRAASIQLAYLIPGAILGLLVDLAERLRKPATTLEHLTIPDRARQEIEARQHPVQNSMILVTAVPRRWLARLKQSFFLRLINLRLQRNVVGLNDIRTIHFARWLTFEREGKRQLLFMVAYDESWEAYIDSFVDNDDVNRFLKAIWRPTQGFPRGTPFVEPFKEWIRGVQSPTLAWYSAYRHGKARLHADTSAGISVTDLHEALQLRRALVRPSLRGFWNLGARQHLRTFLEQGRFPFQKKLMGMGAAAYHVLAGLLARLHLRLTLHGRKPHVIALGKEPGPGAPPIPAQPALVAAAPAAPLA